MASMVLADSVYELHSRRLRQVLVLGGALLAASALWIATFEPFLDSGDAWLHPPCPITAPFMPRLVR
jgi:hypothetical protein